MTDFTAGFIRLTIIEDGNKMIKSREVLLGDLLMNRKATLADKNLFAPGGLVIGRRSREDEVSTISRFPGTLP